MDVIGIGHPVINLGIAIDHLPQTNQAARRLGMTWQVGGKVATALSCICRLGYQGAIAGRVAQSAAAYVKNDLERDGVDTSHLLEQFDAQSYLTISLAEQETGGRSFLSTPQTVRDLTPDELGKAFVQSAKYFYAWVADPLCRTAMQWCREVGGQTVFDADTFSPEIEAILPLTDHLIASEFYYRKLFGHSREYEANLRALSARQGSGKVTIVTFGSDGLIGLDESGNFFTLPCFPTSVQDSTGAGDVFHGAYVAGRLSGRSAMEASRLASATAAIKCTRLGCRAGLPTMEQVLAFMEGRAFDASELDARAERYSKLPFEL